MTSSQRVRFGYLASVAAAVLQLGLSSASAANSPLVLRYDGGFGDFANTVATDNLGNAYVGAEIESSDHKREFAVLKYDPSGALKWTAKYSNALHGTDAGGVRSVAVDTAGNVYAAGFVYTNVTLFTVNMDWLVVSYSPDGIERWSQRINGTANVWDAAGEVIIDKVGNVYVGGSINDVANADGAGWTIIKYSSNGVPVWRHTDVRSDGTRDEMSHLHFDVAGNLIGAGSNTAIQSSAQHKIVTTKLDPDGNVVWRRLFSDTALSDDVVSSMDVDAAGNIYVTGETVATTNPELEHVPITLKYDGGGAFQFMLRGDGAGGTSVKIDAFGDVVVSGTSMRESGIVGLAATAKYDTAGNRKWLASGVAGMLAADKIGNIYASSSLQLFGTSNAFDVLTVKIASDGTIGWQHRFDGALSPTSASRDDAIAIVVDPFDNAFVTANAQNDTKSDIFTLRYAANVTPQQPPASISAPTALSANATSGRVSLAWVDNSNNETTFSVERCLGKTCTNFSPVAQLGANSIAYSDTGVSKNTSYRYRVRALNGPTASPYSNIVTATTPRK